jgi:tRNA(fMet)-specific endonuclease VapC
MALPGGYLLDTNILVHLLRGDDLGRYLDAKYHLSGLGTFAISVVTVGELHALALKFGWGEARVRRLEEMLPSFPRKDINSAGVLRAYGQIDAWSTTNGKPMGKNDVWLAATALAENMTLLTLDKDFDHLHPPHDSRAWRVDVEWVDPTSKLP